MRRFARRRAVLFIFLCCVVARPARAEWQLTPFLGTTFATRTTLLADLKGAGDHTNLTVGATGTLLGPGVLGVEGEFAIAPAFFEADDPTLVASSRVWTLMGNLVVAFPLSVTGDALRPYAVGGVGVIRAAAGSTGDVFPIDGHFAGINVGGGVIGMFDERRGLRLDLRYFRKVSGGGGDAVVPEADTLGFWRGTAGLVLRF